MEKPTRPIKISEEVAAKCDAPNQFDNFDALVANVLAVPHGEVIRRERQYKKQSDANPKKRGPKRKVGASRALRA